MIPVRRTIYGDTNDPHGHHTGYLIIIIKTEIIYHFVLPLPGRTLDMAPTSPAVITERACVDPFMSR